MGEKISRHLLCLLSFQFRVTHFFPPSIEQGKSHDQMNISGNWKYRSPSLVGGTARSHSKGQGSVLLILGGL